MSDSPNSQNPDPKSPDNQNPDPKNPNNENPEISSQSIEAQAQSHEEELVEEVEEEEEEEGECGFCLFMKGGGCKDFFIEWENCVEEAEKNKLDIVEKCFEKTASLKKCMEAHMDYYEPILRAEKAAEEELKQEMERDAELKKDEIKKD